MRASLSTQRCDRPAAEAAVAAAYAAAGLAPPAVVVWMDSPLGGMMAAQLLRHPRPMRPRGLPARAALSRIEDQLSDQLPEARAWLAAGVDHDWPELLSLDEMKSAINTSYYGYSVTEEVLWNPLSRSLRYQLETALGGPLIDPIGALELGEDDSVQFWLDLRSRFDELNSALAEIYRPPIKQLYAYFGRPLPPDIRRALYESVEDSVGFAPDPDSVLFWKWFGGWLDPWINASEMAMCSCALPLAGLAPSPKLDSLVAAMWQVGWWWPMREAVVLTDRPTELSRDAQGQLSVLAYADGYRVDC